MADDNGGAPRQALAKFNEPRLPYHPAIEERFGVGRAAWKALVEAVYPAAKSVDAVILVLSYCQGRKLDPFKRPVHIVPVWDSNAGKLIDTVWPGISETRTTAMRTKLYAGCDETVFGPDIEEEFTWEDKGKRTHSARVTYPEWARVTVYRIVAGERVPVVGPRVYWKETYATISRFDMAPNEMWRKRPRGQIEKCAEAASLRRAFPEELGDEPTADEMEGATIHGSPPPSPPTLAGAFGKPADDAPVGKAPEEPPPESDAAAPRAAKPKGTRASATPASTASAGETSGQPVQGKPSSGGDLLADAGEDVARGASEPGPRSTQDATAASDAGTTDGQLSAEDDDADAEGLRGVSEAQDRLDAENGFPGDRAPTNDEPDAEVARVFEAFEAELAIAPTWEMQRVALARLAQSEEFKRATAQQKADARSWVYDAATNLPEPPQIEAEPFFFNLWLLVKTPSWEQVAQPWQRLIRTDAYKVNLRDEQKEAISGQVNKIRGVK